MREAILKSLHTIWLQLYDIWKSKTIETVSGVARDWWGEGWVEESERNLGALKLPYVILQWWIYTIIYLSELLECMTSTVNLNVNYKLWIKWCVNVGSTAVTNVPLGWVMLTVEGFMHVWGCYTLNPWTFHSVLLWTYNFSKKKNYTNNQRLSLQSWNTMFCSP